MSIRESSEKIRKGVTNLSKYSTDHATPAKPFPGLVTSQGAEKSHEKILESETVAYTEVL